jgi:hypothetical protein
VVNGEKNGNGKPDTTGENGRDANGRFLKGHKGSGGRPPNALSLTDELRRQIDEPCPHKPGLTWRQAVVRRLMELAVAGDIRAQSELWDRLDGKVPQQQEVTGKDGGPIEVKADDIAQAVENAMKVQVEALNGG